MCKRNIPGRKKQYLALGVGKEYNPIVGKGELAIGVRLNVHIDGIVYRLDVNLPIEQESTILKRGRC
jgi:hypothetical protein